MNNTKINQEQYLTEKEVSSITRRAIQTLRNDRHCGRGFPYIKLGRSVRYCKNDVIEHMEQRKILTEDSIMKSH
jgi:hypothetical protein